MRGGNKCASVPTGTSSCGSRTAASRPIDYGYRGLLHGMRRVAAEEGILALWRGILPRLALKSFGSSIWYTTYMWSRRALATEPE